MQGFLKQTWMERMRTERPSCLILCFDWRRAYDAASRCGECCVPSSPASAGEGSIFQPCGSEIQRCFKNDGGEHTCGEQHRDGEDSGHAPAARTAAQTVHLGHGQSSLTSFGSPTAAPPNLGSKNLESYVEPRGIMPGSEVASAETEAMTTIQFFRERLQRRFVAPKMVRVLSATAATKMNNCKALNMNKVCFSLIPLNERNLPPYSK